MHGTGRPALTACHHTALSAALDPPNSGSARAAPGLSRPVTSRSSTTGRKSQRQFTRTSARTLQLVVRHTDAEREYAYDRDPILGSGTEKIIAVAARHQWTLIDMATDWPAVFPP